MPTDKEWAEMALEAEQEMRALFDEYVAEARGKKKKAVGSRQSAESPAPELPAPAAPPTAGY